MAGEERSVKLKIDNVRKVYDTRNGEMIALNNVSLDIKENEFICVVGPSGCGKSTLLNIIAGLLEPTSGKVLCNGVEVKGTGTERGVVFQQYALFPWMTVRKNVMFGLNLKGIKGKKAEETVMKYIKMVQLEEFADHYPKELSGGMKQRVAIARAYAVNPSVLLMDEPFGALDAQTRTQLQTELLETWEKEKKTCFFITHDVDEAIILAQKVIIMSARRGRIEENGDAKLAESGVRAGSTLTQNVALKNLLTYTGSSLEDILPLFTENPAKLLGIFNRKGSIAEGKDADLVVLDEANGIADVFVGGRRIKKQHTFG